MTLTFSLTTLFEYAIPALILIAFVYLFYVIRTSKEFNWSERNDCTSGLVVITFIIFFIYLGIYNCWLKYYTFDAATKELICNLNDNPKYHAQVVDDFLKLHPDYVAEERELNWVKINNKNAAEKIKKRLPQEQYRYKKNP